jgi:hypothetical protein
MISSIQLSRQTKELLDRIRTSPRESYEDIIVGMINEKEKQKKDFEELMIEGYKEMADDDLKMAKEWESTLMDGLDDEDWSEYS